MAHLRHILVALLLASLFPAAADARGSSQSGTTFRVQAVAGKSGASPPQSVAQIRTVNITSDTDDGACNAAGCSLREAINAAVPGDTINFSALFDTPQTINLTSALPVISKDLTITGPGAGLLEVRRDTGGDYAIFHVVGGATVSISGLAVSNGSLSGISNSTGTLALSNMIVTANTGSGVVNSGGGLLTIADSVVSFNATNYLGGGIWNFASTLTVTNTLIVGNVAGEEGGGIANEWGVVTVDSSTIANNTVVASDWSGGGGVVSISADMVATVTLTNTTISGNTASSNSQGGSAIANISGGSATTSGTATLAINNCTIAGNSGDAPAAVVADAYLGGTAKITLKNTILDNPSLPNLAVAESGTILSNGNNLANDSGSPFLRVTPPADVINTDPKLAPLGYYGGPTPTHLLRVGSPAIDAGNNIGAPTTDQRGAPRPVGAKVDIGAVEMHPLLVTTTADPGDGTCDATCALRDAGARRQCRRQRDRRHPVQRRVRFTAND